MSELEAAAHVQARRPQKVARAKRKTKDRWEFENNISFIRVWICWLPKQFAIS
jgi:hypothetical protein